MPVRSIVIRGVVVVVLTDHETIIGDCHYGRLELAGNKGFLLGRWLEMSLPDPCRWLATACRREDGSSTYSELKPWKVSLLECCAIVLQKMKTGGIEDNLHTA